MTSVLAACSSNYGTSGSGTDSSQLVDFVKGAWSGDSKHISLQDASAVPFASIGVRIGSGPEQMLVLASRNGDTFTWTSRSHVVLSIRNGRIARSVGLDHDISGLIVQGPDRVSLPDSRQGAQESEEMLADFASLNLYSVPISCKRISRGPETISILGTKLELSRVDETCISSQQNWSFDNSYWIDPQNRFVWRSLQFVAPGDARIEVEVLRPPA
jgi:hypothetical protein